MVKSKQRARFYFALFSIGCRNGVMRPYVACASFVVNATKLQGAAPVDRFLGISKI
jgi:hypothetical protein